MNTDAPESWQENLAKELTKNEQFLLNTLFDSPAQEAKAWICLSYDWYNMGNIAKGQELIWKAEKACPTYFHLECRKDMSDSPTFALLMNAISIILMEIATTPRKE